MQSVAQGWLVYTLTGSATALGLVIALQTLPVLLLGPYAGVVADRVDKRKLMMVAAVDDGPARPACSACSRSPAAVTLWEVYLLAVLLGLNNTFENPARQAFVLEMVGPDGPAQRGQPQLRAGQRRPGRRPGHRRSADHARRHWASAS